jgi:hypothetical protein
MRKSIRRLAPVAALALMPLGAMPIASAAPCGDGQWWSPHSSACEPLPCPHGSAFDPKDDVCECNFGWRWSPAMDLCEPSSAYFPPPVILHP